ncbi:MAG: GH116 family glycosyl hydrolase, partial [Candidatus Geothermincolales bacterium]
MATVVALLFGLLPLSAPKAQAYSAEGRVIVELSGVSNITTHGDREIKGTDHVTKQPYKFRQERWGRDFTYLLSGLRRSSYDVEFSFFEPVYGPGERVFTVYANGNPLAGLTNLDIASKVGQNTAYQVTSRNVAAPGGKMELRFLASSREATICNIRLLSSGTTALEINVLTDRHWQSLPVRFVNRDGQAAHEVILGRLGSRFMINPQPQFLAWRQSPLGTWSDDLSELVLAFRDAEGDIRCLPFTARYPVFSQISQRETVTGVEYVCGDPSLPFQVKVTFRAPFYPRDIRLSSAPFFYLDVEVLNRTSQVTEGTFLLALAHRDDNTGPNSPSPLTSAPGYRFRTRYTFGSESYVRPDNNSGFVAFDEALALYEDEGVTWHYQDPVDTSWIWPSPSGYPLPYRQLVYTFTPRGYTGLEWGFQLPPNEGQVKNAVLAAHSSSPVLNVRGDNSYRFLYNRPGGPELTSVEAVVGYAVSERDEILAKSDFFDRLFSSEYLSPFPEAGRRLLAMAFQNFIINTWWCYGSGGQEWFSVWEGIPCMFHSTIDVEYNNAWFYLLFWPELLGKLLREWTYFEKTNPQGKYLSHDMGVVNRVTGMAYPHDMPVEENANYLLLLYSYWKHTGDTEALSELYPKASEYLRFLINCDVDGNGLPDLHTSNTIDQGSDAIQHARNQVYLGVKVLASCRAFVEMSEALGKGGNLTSSATDTVARINVTLGDLWLGDHFAICDDPDIPPEEAEAYSLYASNGLLYLLASGLDAGLTVDNLERMKKDIASGASRLTRRYGDVHTSVKNENQWVSQNVWRDAIGYYLGLAEWPRGQDARTSRYWNLQLLYATQQRGGFWDVCDYRDYYFTGTSEAFARGFASPEQLQAYLQSLSGAGEEFSGAFSLLEPYQQSLGYYPRGATALVLIPALARLRLDRPSGILLYEPAWSPARVPVFACADWEAPDPAARIPLLVFDERGNLVQVSNRDLLPGRLAKPGYRPIADLEARPF